MNGVKDNRTRVNRVTRQICSQSAHHGICLNTTIILACCPIKLTLMDWGTLSGLSGIKSPNIDPSNVCLYPKYRDFEGLVRVILQFSISALPPIRSIVSLPILQ
jgi:hypothetical protein